MFTVGNGLPLNRGLFVVWMKCFVKTDKCHDWALINKLLSRLELMCHLHAKCEECGTKVPEDAERNDVETSIGSEEGAGPEDLRQEPLYVVIFLPPPENRCNLQHNSTYHGC